MPSYIARCVNCKPHPFQDSMYGSLIRVVNLSKNKSQPGVEAGNCTVCGSLVKRGTAVSKK